MCKSIIGKAFKQSKIDSYKSSDWPHKRYEINKESIINPENIILL